MTNLCTATGFLTGALLLAACSGGGPGVAGPALNTDAGEFGDAGATSATPTPDEFGCYGTGSRWTRGNRESPFMHPGGDCIDCHEAMREGPRYASAGSVNNYWDERLDCAGTAGITVELTGADGTVVTATTNGAGNFWFRSTVMTPYTARLIGPDGSVRQMFTPQTDLDCMHCHTEMGVNGAPGRIVAP
ncbi:MAG: hypothetical protein GXP55_17945 [Deltaproteobacteria bacterium]|nr:hypothetical protein [Deltaproteobacteria bacterium]